MDLVSKRHLEWYPHALFNSYAQLFFSNNRWFGFLLFAVTFIDIYVGMLAWIAVTTALWTGKAMGLNTYKIKQGYYGFNALLVGIGLGIYFKPDPVLLFIILITAVLTLLVSLTLEGVLGKYGLPFLSLPFIFVYWLIRLSSRQFEALGISERGVYVLNDLQLMGGKTLVDFYEWWNAVPLPETLRLYFLSLGAIFFQQNILSGVVASLGLLIYSRIAFLLSWVGLLIALAMYNFIQIPFTEISFSYIGFNYILVAIALGGFFIIPNINSFISLLFIIPLTVILSISIQEVLNIFYVPTHSFPFNLTVLLVLYGLKFREDNRIGLSTIFWQQNSPEKNLYTFTNFMERFGKENPIHIYLPFFGEWKVTQGHNGRYTHKGDWKHAWDFEIVDGNDKTFKNEGDYLTDYYCYDKNILAPADGKVESVINDIQDNIVGTTNLEKNWGNTIIIKHGEFLYSKLSHLKKDSILPKPGDLVKKGEAIARLGNSGNSPYPHLHFQLQTSPYLGAKTIDYPLSDIWVEHKGNETIQAVGNPRTSDKVSNLQPQQNIKAGFAFITGSQMIWEDHNGEKLVWEIKRDYQLNRFLECLKSGAKAFYTLSDSMLYFTHFEGKRNTEIYHFFLSAQRISFGFTSGLQLKDSIAIHQIFRSDNLFIQDFLAPFYRFLSAKYLLKYPKKSSGLSLKDTKLEGSIREEIFGKTLRKSDFVFTLGHSGIKSFRFHSRNLKTSLACKAG
jgi:urea transporter